MYLCARNSRGFGARTAAQEATVSCVRRGGMSTPCDLSCRTPASVLTATSVGDTLSGSASFWIEQKAHSGKTERLDEGSFPQVYPGVRGLCFSNPKQRSVREAILGGEVGDYYLI